MLSFLPQWLRFWERRPIPIQVPHRATGSDAAFVFLHGFGGNTSTTWGKFPDFLKKDPRLRSWDVFGLGYPSTLRIDIPGIWAADPSIDTLALSLRTALSLPPFDRCRAIAIAAHSMGGLVVQRALLDDPTLADKVSHLFLFGTPSNGLIKAWFGRLFKRQFRDMRAGRPFITRLREDWNTRFGGGTKFFFRAVGGNRDEFVPIASSVEPFPDEVRRSVTGNHVEIVKPEAADHPSVLLVVQGLTGEGVARDVIDSARLAVELKRFREAVDRLEENADRLDPDALVSLALAYDGLGQGAKALAVLEQRYKGGISSTDALGVLGGRLKRRWLVERKAEDLARARELYSAGLRQAEEAKDSAQAYYHAINIAFLDLLASSANSAPNPNVRAMAECALAHCATAPETHWRIATEAEAALMLGNLDMALELYGRAIGMAESQRDVESMYSQAVRVADRMFGRRAVKRFEELSGFPRQ
ncbi:alpha/beta fold hydrolase [Microvirga massiliensis]|uniref:alpha/beta fold hydrolase n=1 Tax=Microvirga massiliensis TaxID=1033741 RepID=UPI00062B9DDE|nr:alpha/beta fold hydrolase [Microvirga massiliensis]